MCVVLLRNGDNASRAWCWRWARNVDELLLFLFSFLVSFIAFAFLPPFFASTASARTRVRFCAGVRAGWRKVPTGGGAHIYAIFFMHSELLLLDATVRWRVWDDERCS